MEIAKIQVNATTGRCLSRKQIPAKLVGGTVSVEFADPIWDRLSKTVVFRCGESRIAEFDGTTAIIPWEILEEPGKRLYFGIWGNDPVADLQLPLIEVPIGILEKATEPDADPGTDPTLPVWAQLQQDIEDLKSTGVGKPGEKGDPGEDGGWYTPAVTQPEDDVVQFAFTPSKTSMPFVEPVAVKIPHSGGNVAYDEEQELTEEQKAQARANIGAQPVGEYITEVPEGYAKNEDIEKVDRKVDTLREVVSKFHSNIVETASGDVIAVSDSSDMELAGLRVFGKTTQNGTPTPEAPVELVSVGESVKVTVCGKNLLKIEFDQKTSSGVVFSPGEDGNVGLSGVSDGYGFAKVASVYLQEGISYYASMKEATPGTLNIRVIDRTVNPVHAPMSGVGAFTVNKSGLYDFEITTGPTFKGPVACYPQLEIGSVATEYEPYNEQILSISTPNGLPGIPVTSGGNYTDENGQQWVCDEVDFAKGVYVQRINQKQITSDTAFYPESSWASGAYAAYGFIPDALSVSGYSTVANIMTTSLNVDTPDRVTRGNVGIGQSGASVYFFVSEEYADENLMIEYLTEKPITIQYILATPIETALSADALTAYATLHTNYPNTTIFNDGGADMEVKYVADTKLYVDKKFAELAQAMLSQ